MKQISKLIVSMSVLLCSFLHSGCFHQQMSIDTMKENFVNHENEFSHATKVFQLIPDSIKTQSIVWFYYHNDGSFGIEVDIDGDNDSIIGSIKLKKTDIGYTKALKVLGWTDDTVSDLIYDMKTIHCNGIVTIDNANYDVEIYEDCDDYLCHSYLHIRPGCQLKFNKKQHPCLSKIGKQFVIHSTSIL